VALAVPSERRAQTATAAIADTGAPIAVVVWSAASCAPVLPMTERAGAELCFAPGEGMQEEILQRLAEDAGPESHEAIKRREALEAGRAQRAPG
jgi:hypothetical protein